MPDIKKPYDHVVRDIHESIKVESVKIRQRMKDIQVDLSSIDFGQNGNGHDHDTPTLL